jgi:alanine-alpha-ketoisovalerate/valine-pyruvate aminotransferase
VGPFERLDELIRDRAAGVPSAITAHAPVRRVTEEAVRPYLAQKVLHEARAVYRAVLARDPSRLRETWAKASWLWMLS